MKHIITPTNFQPVNGEHLGGSSFYASYMYKRLAKKMTPKWFTGEDGELTADKKAAWYIGWHSNKEMDLSSSQQTLTAAGMARVMQELRRLADLYQRVFSQYVTANEFLAIYDYTTNDYTVINSQLRFGGKDPIVEQLIAWATSGILKLAKVRGFTLTPQPGQDRVTLTRLMDLPQNVIELIRRQLEAGSFKDKAFLSTSYKPGGVECFKGNVEMNLHLRGAHIGIRVDQISPFGQEEQEYLVLPGQRLFCHARRMEKRGDVYVINIEANALQSITATKMLAHRWVEDFRRRKAQHSIGDFP